ncbi:putative histidine kinase [Methanocella paludicola SANAE]|uniref:histidine kinase n=1 Tax=Methanocella paludicola (strain DSM 17711 / JCM 13418 / NBRC 101707 / SANAE) TaxID=304371 RepID=D1YXS9_METPS|nr:putative histidine kinase [Methanocella paludicola SANAE]
MTAQKHTDSPFAKYHLIFDSVRDIILLMDEDGTILDANQAAVQAYGYSKNELRAMNASKLRSPEERQKMRDQWEQCGEGGLFESLHMRKNGATFPAEINLRWLQLDGRQVIVAVVRDITERKRAEDELQRANRSLHALSKCDDAVIHAGEEKSLLENVCQIIVETGGYRMAWIGYVEHDEAKTVRPVAQKGYESGYLESVRITWADRERGRGPTGASIRTKSPHVIRNVLTDPSFAPWREEAVKRGYASVLGLPLISEGNVFGALTIYSGRPDAFDEVEVALLKEMADDIAYGIVSLRYRLRQTEIEKALRKSQYILAKAQEIAHVGNWAWNPRIDEMSWSDEGFRIFGYEPGSVRLTLEWFISRIFEGDRDNVREFAYAARDDNKLGSIDYRIMMPDGTIRYVTSVADKVVRDHDGTAKWVYGISQDITERKQAEVELQEAKEQAELYVDLMGHDINNMNQIGMGYLELALRALELEGSLGPQYRTFIEKPYEAFESSSRLIDTVIKLRRAKALDIRMEVVDLGRILDEAKARYSLVPGRSITINTHYSHVRRYPVMANVLLADVFSNLLGNSIKHSEGPLAIDIRLSPRAEPDGKYYVVTIEDNGPGIPDDLKAGLFARFHRGRTKAKGTGLGLFLVKMLVESFSGKIWVEDRVPGDFRKGSKFVVVLRAADE